MTDHSALIERPCAATDQADLRDRIMNPNVAKSEAEWWASREIERLESILRDQQDRHEGMEEDLYQAVLVAYRRGAVEWTMLNYPQWINAISAGREVCPLPSAPNQAKEAD